MTISRPSWWRAETCAQCEYDLRGLDVEGQCPECGLHIAKSIPLPVEAWPSALRKKVTIGAGMTSMGNVMTAPMVVFVLILLRPSADWFVPPLRWLLVADVLVLTIGWWVMSSVRCVDLPIRKARRRATVHLARDSALFGLSGLILGVVIVIMNRWDDRSDTAAMVGSMIAVISGVIGVVCYGAAMLDAVACTSIVSERSEDRLLKWSTRVFRVGAAVVMLIGVLLIASASIWIDHVVWGAPVIRAVVFGGVSAILIGHAIVLSQVGRVVFPRLRAAGPASSSPLPADL